MKPNSKLPSLVVVGSGISGCMCALYAARAGYKVTLVSKGPDQRLSGEPDPYSSTFGGEDSRYVTLTEGHPYLGTAAYVNQMYPDMQSAFMKSIHEGGWLSQDFENYSITVQEWLKRRFLANEDHAAIENLFTSYIEENRESMRLWQELLQNSPQLCTGISLNNSGILRLYGNQPLYEMAEHFHRKHHVLIEALSPTNLVRRFPLYTEGVKNGFIKGALVVEGVSFRVQRLVKNILYELEQLGAQLKFSHEVVGIQFDRYKQVAGLSLKDGTTLQADNYSLHLGAYDSAKLLDQINLPNEVSGVAGGWIIMPKPTGAFLPIKVHDGQHEINGQRTPVVDLNINPARLDDGSEVLIIGGGYLFCGTPPFDLPLAAQNLMLSEIHRVTELVLGAHYREMKAKNLLFSSNKVCVRSFTPTDKELTKIFPTNCGGILTAVGGGNTGTTAKAAWVSQNFIKLLNTGHNKRLALAS